MQITMKGRNNCPRQSPIPFYVYWTIAQSIRLYNVHLTVNPIRIHVIDRIIGHERSLGFRIGHL